MLLFTKKRFADAIFDGSKTIELRSGHRYRNVSEDDELSINGRFRVRVKSRFVLDSASDVVEFLKCFHVELGFTTTDEAILALGDCYTDTPLPMFAWEIERI